MKWSQIKKGISLTLCVLMVLTLLPVSSLADDTTPAVTSTPAEATQTASVETTAGSETSTPVPSDAATPTPAITDAAASASPTEEVVPDATKTYVVDFVIDHQTIWGMQQTVAEGELVAAPTIPAVPDGEEYVGQVFLYWYAKEGVAYDFGTPVTSDLVLYAQFGTSKDAPASEEEPIVADDAILFSAFSMAAYAGCVQVSTAGGIPIQGRRRLVRRQ